MKILFRISMVLILMIVFSSALSQTLWRDTLRSMPSDSIRMEYLYNLFTPTVYGDPNLAFYMASAYDSIGHISNSENAGATAKNMYGMVYYVKGEFSEAIDYFVESVEYFEGSDDLSTLGRVYNNIATCYQNRSDNAKSTEYFEKALNIYEQLQDSTWIGSIHSNLSLQHLYDGKLEQSQHHIDIAVPILEVLEKKVYLGLALLNRGNLKIEKEEYESARKDFNLSMEYVPEAMSPLARAAALTGIGASYTRSGRHNQALPFLLSSLELAEKIDNTEQIQETNKELSDLYEKKGNYREALTRYKKYNEAKDSSFTLAQDAKLADALSKYESEKKEQQINLLSAQNELSNIKLNSSRRVSWILGIGVTLLVGLLYWLFIIHKKSQKTAQEKDTLLREIHHRVKNNLQVISALLTLQSAHLKDAQAKTALQEGQDRVQSMALIHKDLYQHDNLKGVNTKDYLEQLIYNLFTSYKIHDSDIRLMTDIEDIRLDVDTMIPMGLMVNELISNALKHAFNEQKKGILSVILKEKNDGLHLTLKDNGKGVTDLNVLKQKSFGYSLIYSFARKLDTDIKVINDDGLQIKLVIKNYTKA